MANARDPLLSAYGNPDGVPVPIKLSEFKPDSQELSNGLVVLESGWQQKLENNKRAFMSDLVQRARFTAAYPTAMTPAEFVNKLFANARVDVTDPDYGSCLTEFAGATDTSDVAARARVLRRVAENSALTRAQFNQAFVLMEYFGYNDWQLTANDSNSGGANKFSIEDITGGKTPFTITAGAPTNSLFVASSGKVAWATPRRD